MCYSVQHMLYFVFSTDFKLHVYSANMIRVCSMATGTSVQSHCFFSDHSN